MPIVMMAVGYCDILIKFFVLLFVFFFFADDRRRRPEEKRVSEAPGVLQDAARAIRRDHQM